MNIIKEKPQNKKLIYATICASLFLGARFYFNGPRCKVVRDLKDKIVIITGANTGIGAVTARELANLGANIILACRDQKRTEPLYNELKKKNQKVDFIQLDLSDLRSVEQFAENFKKQYSRLDILINNAGVMALPTRQVTKQNFEMQFGTNHVGHFYLTTLLMDILKQTEQCRVINVSSMAHNRTYKSKGHINFEDINFEKSPYDPFTVYSQSKLANILFTKQLQLVFDQQGIDGRVVALHPGVVRTELGRYMFENKPLFGYLFRYIFYPFYYIATKSSYYGAQTTLYCALENQYNLVKGGYYSDCKIKASSLESQDMNIAKLLWIRTEEMIKEALQKQN